MTNNRWPKRLYALDVSRGFAALTVVIWHWQHFAYVGTHLPSGFVRANQPMYALFKIAYEKGFMGVQYFFLLSGFIFFWLYRAAVEKKLVSFRDFWVQRISRLYPLHLTTLFVVALLQSAYRSQNGSYFVYTYNDKYHFLLNIFFASKWGFEKGWSFNAPVWSVSIEILLYFIFFTVAYYRFGKPLFYFIVSISAFSITLVNQNEILEGMSLFFFGGVVYYLTSYLSTASQKLRTTTYWLTGLAWGFTIFNFYVVYLGDFIQGFGLPGVVFWAAFPNFVLFPLTVCSLALLEIERGIGVFKSFSWFGNITYSSYLLQFPLQLLFGLAVSYELLNVEFYLSPLWLIVFFSILIPLSYLVYIRFERPVQNRIRQKFLQQENS